MQLEKIKPFKFIEFDMIVLEYSLRCIEMKNEIYKKRKRIWMY